MAATANFGDTLRTERESRGIRLDQITQTTKISTRHLRALEGNDFGLLPGGVFNKGIVRSYARVVGLDEEVCVENFMRAYRASGKMLEDDQSWTSFAENAGCTRDPERKKAMARLRWVGVGVLLVALGSSGLLTYNLLAAREGWSPVKMPHIPFSLPS